MGGTKGTNLQGPKDVERSTKKACNNNFNHGGALETAYVQGPEFCAMPQNEQHT